MPLNFRFLSLLALVAIMPSQRLSGQMASPGSDPQVIATDNKTPTWAETIAAFDELAASHPNAHLLEIGKSDVGRPIHAFILSLSTPSISALPELKEQRLAEDQKLGLLINNAIHPGEPCGVDASVAWLRSLLADEGTLQSTLSTLDIAVIPMYNVGGALNRNCCTRTNQDGPEEYGFRGNARNLDLNRDFIKMDSRNAEAFVALFQAFAPNIFIDTHTTNGADYPYEMTLISTQPDKAGPVLGPYIREVMEPALFTSMAQRGVPMSPYVYSKGETPDDGILGFLETPRYSTGYGVLFGTIGFTAEAHMLKPFPVRVEATKQFIESTVEFMMKNTQELHDVKAAELDRWKRIPTAPVRWELTEDHTPIEFEGYVARREISQVTGELRLKYDRDAKWTKTIPHYNHYEEVVETRIPEFWVVPQAWREVVERMRQNGVEMTTVSADTIAVLEAGEIKGFKSNSRPYEGHHVNACDTVIWSAQPVQLYCGDFILHADQPALRYLCETLDPRGHDSFFTWNFFDSAMQQKEHFSAYVFEETAAEMLANDPALKEAFGAALAADTTLREDARAQLNWLYKASPHFEKTANRYPVYRSMTSRP
jgi:hypothetical protein